MTAPAPELPATRLRHAPAAERARVCREVYDHVLSNVLRDHERGGRGLRLGSNDKITRFLQNAAGSRRSILEIGCGFGATAIALARGPREVVGVDASQVGIDTARMLAGAREGLRFERMDATDLRFPESVFEMACSIDLVEHLLPEDVPRHLAEVHRVLRPGGLYVVKTPSILTGPHEGEHPGDQGFLHFQEYRYGTLLPLLRAAGFARFMAPALSMRMSARVPGPPRLPAAFQAIPEGIALLASRAPALREYLARLLGVKQVVIAAWKDEEPGVSGS